MKGLPAAVALPVSTSPSVPSSPSTAGADGHVRALREAVEKEYLQFRRSLEDVASQHFRSQEELFAQCLKRIAAEGQTPGKAEVMELTKCRSPGRINRFVAADPAEHLSLRRKEAQFAESGLAGDGRPVPGDSRLGSKGSQLAWATEGDSTLSLALGSGGLRPRGWSPAAFPTATTVPTATTAATTTPPGSGENSLALADLTLQLSPQPVSTLLKSESYQSLVSLGTNCMSSGTRSSESGGAPSEAAFSAEKRPSAIQTSKAWLVERSPFQRCARRLYGVAGWWRELEEPERTGRLADLVHSTTFEGFCACVIMINAGMSCIVINQEIQTYGAPPGLFITLAERAFLTIYTFELVVKLLVHRLFYFCNADLQWNWFDFVLVMFSLFDQFLTILMSTAGDGGNFGFMRTLRIMRMARVLRGLRVMRFFSELKLMLNSLIGSVSSLMWSIAMLSLIFYIFGLVFVQGVANFIVDQDLETFNPAEYSELFMQFGSVQRAVLSLYQASTGGNDWHAFLDEIAKVGTMYGGLFIFFMAFSQIALLNILTAIFVQRAMKLAKPDLEAQARDLVSEDQAVEEQLWRIFNDADVNKTGIVSLSQFCKQIKTGTLGQHLTVMGLEVKDPEAFYAVLSKNLDTDSDEIDIGALIQELMWLRGHASSIELTWLSQNLRTLARVQEADKKAQLVFQRDLHARLARLGPGEQVFQGGDREHAERSSRAPEAGGPGQPPSTAGGPRRALAALEGLGRPWSPPEPPAQLQQRGAPGRKPSKEWLGLGSASAPSTAENEELPAQVYL